MKQCSDCQCYWQNTDTENECEGQEEICHEFREIKENVNGNTLQGN